MFRLKHRIEKLYAVGLLTLLSFYSIRADAQDDIDEPAGDIAEAQEDGDFEGSGQSVASPTESATDDVESGAAAPMTIEAAGEGEGEADPAGPVWESYNDNLKSVAQEVTKGLRVEDVVEPPTEYHYAAFGKPDPFVPPIFAQKKTDDDLISGLEVPIVSPLQRHAVGALKLVGVWQLPNGERKAMIMAPNLNGGAELGIIARNGDPVGNRAGKILAIGDTFLTIREFKLAEDGTREYEDIQMPMGDQDKNFSPGRLVFKPKVKDIEVPTQIILDSDRPTPVPSTFIDPSDKAADKIPEKKRPDVRSAAPGPSQIIAAPVPVSNSLPSNPAAPVNASEASGGLAPQSPVKAAIAPPVNAAIAPPVNAAGSVPANALAVPPAMP